MLSPSADDYLLFKFRPIDARLFDSLDRSELYFARPAQLNDPFDCQVDVAKALENAAARADPKARLNLEKLRVMDDFFQQLQTDLKATGICSFSLKLNNPLMWAHYADNHRGVCLLYKFAAGFFYTKAIVGIGPIEYGVDPLVDWFLSWGRDPQSYMEWERFRDDLLVKMLTIKGPAWAHEEEARIVRKPDGAQSVDRESLIQICFGLQTPQPDADAVRKLVDGRGYKARFCKMERDSKSDFGIHAVDIS